MMLKLKVNRLHIPYEKRTNEYAADLLRYFEDRYHETIRYGEWELYFGRLWKSRFHYAGTIPLYLRVTRGALVEPDDEDEDPRFVETNECEVVWVTLLPAIGGVVYAWPALRTREVSTRRMIRIAQEVMSLEFVRFDDHLELETTKLTRSHAFFVKKMLDTAKDRSSRMVEVEVWDLAGKEPVADVKLFNPDAEREELARSLMTDLHKYIDRCTTRAEPEEDLAHSPLVRHQVAAGNVHRMNVKEPDDDARGGVRVMRYPRTIPDVVQVPVAVDEVREVQLQKVMDELERQGILTGEE